jgi:hypothetical protein
MLLNPEVAIVQVTGDCPEGLHLAGAPGEPVVIDLDGFTAGAAPGEHTRRFCLVRVKLDVQPGFTALVGAPEIRGTEELQTDGAASLSVRWFETGTRGDAWYKRFTGEPGQAGFVETPADWPEHGFPCGASPELNVLVDANARAATLSLRQIKIPSITYKRCGD